jgi:hypothetical protein
VHGDVLDIAEAAAGLQAQHGAAGREDCELHPVPCKKMW